MGKPKHLTKGDQGKPKGKKPQPTPETADEFLAAGVDHESAGEKWRAGDAAKSSRFFIRAFDTYCAGLRQFPKDFDLAYNQARVQLDLAQQPRLLQHIPVSRAELWDRSLKAHRYALTVRPDDADTLFNTAQLLVLIAEPIAESGITPTDSGLSDATEDAGQQAVAQLMEATRLFEQCLVIQDKQFRDFEAAEAAAAASSSSSISPNDDTSMQDAPATSSSAAPSSEESQEEQWASVIEPVTRSTLLDTCAAMLGALTTLIPLITASQADIDKLSSDGLSTVFHYADRLLAPSSTAPSGIPDADVLAFRAAKAKALTTLARAHLYLDVHSIADYHAALTQAYSFPGASTYFPAVVELAEATVDWNSAAAARAPHDAGLGQLRWRALSKAADALVAGLKLPDAENSPALCEQRAALELLRCRLAEEPLSVGDAVRSRGVLLGNAEVFYRGAGRLAKASGEGEEETGYRAREQIVRMLRGEMGELGTAEMEVVVGEMVAEGLLPDGNVLG